MRKAEEILDDILAGGPIPGATTDDYRADAIRTIEQAQREAIEEAAKVTDDIGVTWGTAYQSMTTVISDAIRKLAP